jgi:hypothetical protein
MIDFIGIGAQKSGTSWAYTCLYEHPQVCIPVKEIHFFSRPRYVTEGKEWYEAHFKKCTEGELKGEWSTSYLYSSESAERIHSCYPNVKLLAILRNPITRGYSQYRNAVRGGEIKESVSFNEYCVQEKSVWEQGLYGQQLERFLRFFPREQMLVLIYEDIKNDPVVFMRRIHEFLGIEADFIASMVNEAVNIARTPRMIWLDRAIHHISEFLRVHGLDRFVHMVRTSGITDMIRNVNTKTGSKKTERKQEATDVQKTYFRDDVALLSAIVGRDMLTEWNLK